MLGALGFTQAGVAASSLASAWQSALGNVAAGSTFAALQSLGSSNGLALQWPLLVGGAAYYLVYHAGPLPPALATQLPSRRGPK